MKIRFYRFGRVIAELDTGQLLLRARAHPSDKKVSETVILRPTFGPTNRYRTDKRIPQIERESADHETGRHKKINLCATISPAEGSRSSVLRQILEYTGSMNGALRPSWRGNSPWAIAKSRVLCLVWKEADRVIGGMNRLPSAMTVGLRDPH